MPDKKINYDSGPLLRGFAKKVIKAGIAAAPHLLSKNWSKAASAVMDSVNEDLPDGILTSALEGISLKDRKDRDIFFYQLKKELPNALNNPDFELPESVYAVLLSDLLTPEHLFDLLSQSKQNWHRQLKMEILSVCQKDEQTAMPEVLADALTTAILDGCDEMIRKNYELQEALVLHAEFQEKIEKPVHTDNIAYANNFLQPLFLHKDSPDFWQMTLRNLYVMPAYIECDDTNDHLREKLQRFLRMDNDVPLLLIEGDAGTGKTSLSSWLNYQDQQRLREDAKSDFLFDGRPLVTVRLRDLAGQSVSSGQQLLTLVLQYLRIKHVEDLQRLNPNLVLLLDGFDELCMMKMVVKNQKGFFNQLYDTAQKQHWKLIITSRPEYFDSETLGQRVYERITLQHFYTAKQNAWMKKYEDHSSVCISKEIREYIQQTEDSDANEIWEYIQQMGNSDTKGVCDTPMMLYMLTADEDTNQYKENTWALYRHVFGTVMSRTKYNEVFPDADGTTTHWVSEVRRVLYRVTEEIAFTMFQNSSEKFFLREDALRKILAGLRNEFPELEDADTERLVERCYGLCCYWKTRTDGHVGQGYYASLDEDLDEDLLPEQIGHQGAVEFLHNNVRDFFLAEKLYRELNRTAVARQTGQAEDYTSMTDTLCHLLWYDELPVAVLKFIRQRATYEKERRESGGLVLLDFAGFEVQQSKDLPKPHREIALILQDMSSNGICGNGGNRPGVLNQASPLPLYDRILNIVKNTVAIYRYAYDPYLEENETICWCPRSEDATTLQDKDVFSSKKIRWDNASCQLVNALFSKIFGGNIYGNILGSRGDFSGADLFEAHLIMADLSESDLTGVHLAKADLIGANLSGANLSDTNLSSACMFGANLFGACLNEADLNGADLSEANLFEASLNGANLSEVLLNDAILPDGFSCHDQGKQVAHLKSMNIKNLEI